jgi:hypothetical protein
MPTFFAMRKKLLGDTQAQFGRQVDAGQPAASLEKWLRLNVPTMAS